MNQRVLVFCVVVSSKKRIYVYTHVLGVLDTFLLFSAEKVIRLYVFIFTVLKIGPPVTVFRSPQIPELFSKNRSHCQNDAALDAHITLIAGNKDTGQDRQTRHHKELES